MPIAAGQEIKCPNCLTPVFVAKVQLEYRAEMRSADMRYPSGEDVPYRAELRCPKCDKRYSTINSETALLDGELPNDKYAGKAPHEVRGWHPDD
jgi:DNA-directed RNA polymerase subunit RPC12/RpoP